MHLSKYSENAVHEPNKPAVTKEFVSKSLIHVIHLKIFSTVIKNSKSCCLKYSTYLKWIEMNS